MKTTTKTFIWLAVLAVLAVGGPLAYVWTRPEQPREAAPSTSPMSAASPTSAPTATSATPATVTTTSGQGTSVTYQVQEGTPGAQTDANRFSIVPEEAAPGQMVTARYDVPNAVNIKIDGRAVRGRATKGSMTFAAPDIYTLTVSGPEGNSVTSPPTNVYTFRLEATRKGSGEPIIYEARLNLKPRRE